MAAASHGLRNYSLGMGGATLDCPVEISHSPSVFVAMIV